MKKLVSVVLVLCMAFSALPVLAEDVSAEEVLIAVKSKIDIPEDLTEFEYSQNTYNNAIRYDFMWRNADNTKEMYISANLSGEVVAYNYYENMDYSANRSLINYNLSDAKALAEGFVKKVFSDFDSRKEDLLWLDESSTTSSYSGRYKTFIFTFKRMYKGENVESNYVTVRVRATKEKIYVQDMSAQLDDFSEISKAEVLTENTKAINENEYTQQFPVRFYYAKDYSGEEVTVGLFYSVDKGFVSRVDGNAVTQVGFDSYAFVTDSASEESAMGSANKNGLSEAEVKELSEMDSLIPVSEIEAKLRGIDLLNITDDMKIASTRTNKYDEEYVVNFVLEGEDKRTSVTYNGKTGEVTRIYSYKTNYAKASPEADENTIATNVPKDDITYVVKQLAGDKINETEPEFTTTDKSAALNCERVVNGVAYPENSINVTYSIEEGYVTSYYIYWDKDVSAFPKPEEAVGVDKAKEIIFSISPLYNTFVKTTDGYVPAATIPNGVIINAVTGEQPYSSTEEKQLYTDLDGHWAEDMINTLWEHDIYLPGDKFAPDTAITLADAIKLFSACRNSGVMPVYWTKDYVITYSINNGYIEEGDPDKLLTRKEAFDLLAKMLGYGDIASYDIYKSSYTDLEACGSAEILKAMGILIGDTARPNDNLTRAEAAVMVYRYLSK